MIKWVLVGLVLAAALLICGLYGVIGGAITQASAPVISLRSPPTNPVRNILILGTSLTSRGNWVAVLEQHLQGCAPDMHVRRLARAGASSTWGLTALRDRLAQAAANPGTPDLLPDLLIVEFSSNDASLRHGMPLALSRARHRAIIAAATAADIPVVLATMNPAWERKAWERPGQRRYHAAYRDLVQDLGAGLIDTIPAWAALSAGQRSDWVPDNLHPTDQGMTAIAVPAFEAALRPLVCPPS